MSTQKVTEKILEDAQKEAKDILNSFKQEAANIKKDFSEQIADKKKQIKTEAEDVKKTETLRAISQERLRLNKELAKHKRRLINEVIEDALQQLPAHKDYLKFLITLIEKSGEKTGELTINKRDWKVYGSALEKYMKNKKLNYRITRDDKIIGGLMIKKEKAIYHGSLGLIRELLSDELTIAVSEELR